MNRLDGKVAIITGAGAGMGKETSILFDYKCPYDIELEHMKWCT